ncbi:MAG TPA: hypothetical protein VK210_06940, partial [Terriglobia bacterium]|nr:hypothetical protein [Terriglobia bacterium]
MKCTDIEAQLLEYGELTTAHRLVVDAHLSVCESCCTFHSALIEVDDRLDREFPAIETSPAFNNRVRSRIQALDAAVRKPSPIPEILDFAGYVSIAAAILLTLVSLYPNSILLLAKLTLDSRATMFGEIVVVI